MRKFLYLGAGIGVFVWSALAFAAYGFVDLFGQAASGIGSVPGFPSEPFSVGWFAALARSFGLGAVLVVWLAGVAAIAGTAWILARIFARRRPVPPGPLPAGRFGSSIPSGLDWQRQSRPRFDLPKWARRSRPRRRDRDDD